MVILQPSLVMYSRKNESPFSFFSRQGLTIALADPKLYM